ncbi:MAG: LamB/YcsF family protein [Verrucomicrobia bacterium]|nr:LamB/YcsF family protein [Verrucomicrobiota bacterium]
MTRVDLNCDLGEGAGHDADLMPLITSANIACGAHAGDAATMRETIALAQKHGVAIGAHPGFSDREHFGRRELAIAPMNVAELVLNQIQTLQVTVMEFGARMTHVKLHGALYNMAARDADLADSITKAIWVTDFDPLIYVPWGSELAKAAQRNGLRIANEVFADRTYQRDGSLTPRSRPDALITDEDAAVAQVLRMVREGVVRATDGTDVPIAADTVCLHGDGPHAVAFAHRLRKELATAGVAVKAFGA